MARLALLAAVVGASATCELPALRFKGGELGAVRGLKDSSACRATCVQTLGCLRFTFTWKDPRLEERRLASALPLPPKRPAQVPSNCQLFDSSSHKEPAEEEAVSGLVTCNPSAQREPLGSSRDLFKEVTREPEVAPKDAFFLQEGARPTNTWWSNVFINGQPGQASNFLTQMPYILGPDQKGVQVMQPFLTSPGMEEFQHGLGTFLGADQQLSGPFADAWDEACITMSYRGSSGQMLTFPSCRGSAYVTAEYRGLTPVVSSSLALAIPHKIQVDGRSVDCNNYNFVQGKEIEFTLNTGDTWAVFFPPGMGWVCNPQPFLLKAAKPAPAAGVAVRLAMVKGKAPGVNVEAWRDQLRRHAGSYPIASGTDYHVDLNGDAGKVIFNWHQHRRTMPGYDQSDLLQLLWPVHVSLLMTEDRSAVENGPRTPFKDLRGEAKALAVRGPLALTYELYPLQPEFGGRTPLPPDGTLRSMILEALKGGPHVAGSKYDGAKSDSEFELPQNVRLAVGDTYFSAKLMARLARLIAIAAELEQQDEAFFDKMLSQLSDTLEKWLDKGAATPFIYDKSWGGLVSCGCKYDDCWGGCAPKCVNDVSQPATCPALHDVGYNFGNGFYNDHHFHYGYFIYSVAVLAKFRPEWEKTWRPQVLALIRDYANPSSQDMEFPICRHKDWFMGFSWAGGIKFEPLGRNQESVSEAINSYYAIGVYGTVLANRGDEDSDVGMRLRQLGRLLTAMEVHAGDTYWHVRPAGGIYTNYVHPTVGIMWEHVALHQTWFGGSGWAVEGIQMLPVIPVLEDFLKKDWVEQHFLRYKVNCDSDPQCKTLGWSWLVCMEQAVLSVQEAFDCLRRLSDNAFSVRQAAASGNSLTNSLYWFATRPGTHFVKSWPKILAQIHTTPRPVASHDLLDAPIKTFGHHGVTMNNLCFKGSDVSCPNLPTIRCLGDSCCPDGSLCPSAPYYSSPTCAHPKKIACRGTDGDNPAAQHKKKAKGHCPVGSSVLCPDQFSHCEKSECCPDGSLCPSAPIAGQSKCPKPKVHDCTGLHVDKPIPVPDTCKVGQEVHCPGTALKCWGKMCCPDGRPCPSAPSDAKCWKPKSVDCTEQPKPFSAFGSSDDLAQSLGEESFHSHEQGGDGYEETSEGDDGFHEDDREDSFFETEEQPVSFHQEHVPSPPPPQVHHSTHEFNCDEGKKCTWGASVLCPDGKSRCGGSGCCPDGSLCPSAPPMVPGTSGCQRDKVFDCTCAVMPVIVKSRATCLVGESVTCPNTKAKCAGAGCCPDGSTCPSAPLGAVCPLPKTEDCTGQVVPKKFELHDLDLGQAAPTATGLILAVLAAGILAFGTWIYKARMRKSAPYIRVAQATEEA